jgi:hypothetical protein
VIEIVKRQRPNDIGKNSSDLWILQNKVGENVAHLSLFRNYFVEEHTDKPPRATAPRIAFLEGGDKAILTNKLTMSCGAWTNTV